MKIITEHVNPPYVPRCYDWRAYIDGQEESGPIGYGETEVKATQSLLELIDPDELGIPDDCPRCGGIRYDGECFIACKGSAPTKEDAA